MHPLIVLLTDFGRSDSYVGVMKGVILSIFPDARIVDLNHEIELGNLSQAAYSLECSVDYFPHGTIFLAVVDPGVGTNRRAIAVKTRTNILVGPDNGIFTPFVHTAARCEIRELSNSVYWLSEGVSNTFHGRDIFAPVAAHLAKDARIFRKLGPVRKMLQRLHQEPAQRVGKYLEGRILCFDHFGNAITNVTKQDVEHEFLTDVRVLVGNYEIDGLVGNYGGSEIKRPIAIYNSFDRIEIAWPQGNAKKRARLKIGQKVRVATKRGQKIEQTHF